MYVSDEFKEQLIRANPIEKVIGEYVPLRRSGRDYVCRCPFHNDKTPSLHIYTDSQSYHCYGCQNGGDVITFIEEKENLGFMDAVQFLADRAGLEIPQGKRKYNRENAEKRTKIYEMNRLAANFYFINLVKGNDRSGIRYFQERGILPQTIKKYGLGYSGDSWDELCTYLNEKGYSDDDIIEASLGGRRSNGKAYDIFRKRVIFPIVDLKGNVIGFGGRVLDGSKPKYLNSGDNIVFNKRDNLFSLNFAKKSAREGLILVEGYMDVIAANQAGEDNAVATLGTALTPEQASLIKRHFFYNGDNNKKSLIIAYDNDFAGQEAIERALKLLYREGIMPKVLDMDGAKDPDEYIKKFGAARFRILVDNAADAREYLVEKYKKYYNIDENSGKIPTRNRLMATDRIAGIISCISDEDHRINYANDTAEDFNIDKKSYVDKVEELHEKPANEEEIKEENEEKIKTYTEEKNIAATVPPVKDGENTALKQKQKKCEKAERRIINHLNLCYEEWEHIKEVAPPEYFITPAHRKIYEKMLEKTEEHDRFNISMLSGEITTKEMGIISDIINKEKESGTNEKEFIECANVLKKNNKRDFSADTPPDDDELIDSFRGKNNNKSEGFYGK